MTRHRPVYIGLAAALAYATSTSAPASAGPPAFTIEQFMQAPYPTSLTAALVGTVAA